MTSSHRMSITARVHALLWGAFSLGGFIAAFLLPILIYVNNIAYPLGLWPATTLDPTSLMVTGRLSALFTFLAVAGSLFHGIFRLNVTLTELTLGRLREKTAALGYAVAGAGIVLLIIFLLTLNPSILRLP